MMSWSCSGAAPGLRGTTRSCRWGGVGCMPGAWVDVWWVGRCGLVWWAPLRTACCCMWCGVDAGFRGHQPSAARTCTCPAHPPCRPSGGSCWGQAAGWQTCAASMREPRASLGCALTTSIGVLCRPLVVLHLLAPCDPPAPCIAAYYRWCCSLPAHPPLRLLFLLRCGFLLTLSLALIPASHLTGCCNSHAARGVHSYLQHSQSKHTRGRRVSRPRAVIVQLLCKLGCCADTHTLHCGTLQLGRAAAAI